MRGVPTGATPTVPQGPQVLDGTPYRALGPLGRGGMGEVLDAEHRALGKRVVVKVLHSELSNRNDLVDRMRIEAQALARLDHPNIVAVTDFGQTPGGRTFLVMERLWGRTLRDELRARGAFPPAEAIEIVVQLLDALGAAHELGLVHRDVKLDNIFMCDAPRGGRSVKLLDFGIAKVISGAADGRAPAPLAFPTEEGVAIGTPRFFSPEQARGWKVDARTDIYASGAVLYTLLCGRGPFDDKTSIYDLTRAHAFEPPPPPSRFTKRPLAHDLEAAVLKSLEKQPAARFASAAEFAAALAPIRARLAGQPAEPRWLETETLDPLALQLGKARDAGPPKGSHGALNPRPTVRVPELAAAQEADKNAKGRIAPRPAAGRPAATQLSARLLVEPTAAMDGAAVALAAVARAETAASTPPEADRLAPRRHDPAQAPAKMPLGAFIAIAVLTALLTAGLVLGVVLVALR